MVGLMMYIEYFLYDGAKLGITPGIHFWSSFGSYLSGMESVTEILKVLFDKLNINVDGNSTNKMEMKKALDIIDKKKDDIDDDWKNYYLQYYCVPKVRSILEKYFSNPNGNILEDVFGIILNSDKFNLVTIGQNFSYEHRQFWTESECLLLRIDSSDDFDYYA